MTTKLATIVVAMFLMICCGCRSEDYYGKVCTTTVDGSDGHVIVCKDTSSRWSTKYTTHVEEKGAVSDIVVSKAEYEKTMARHACEEKIKRVSDQDITAESVMYETNEDLICSLNQSPSSEVRAYAACIHAQDAQRNSMGALDVCKEKEPKELEGK